jgi:glycine dehydrogenase subunit 2
MLDYSIPWFWSSHHPWVIPEPMTLEPCETYTKEDIEEYVEVVRTVCDEALNDPDFVKHAPYNSVIHRRKNEQNLDDPEKWALTWKVFKRKFGVK